MADNVGIGRRVDQHDQFVRAPGQQKRLGEEGVAVREIIKSDSPVTPVQVSLPFYWAGGGDVPLLTAVQAQIGLLLTSPLPGGDRAAQLHQLGSWFRRRSLR